MTYVAVKMPRCCMADFVYQCATQTIPTGQHFVNSMRNVRPVAVLKIVASIIGASQFAVFVVDGTNSSSLSYSLELLFFFEVHSSSSSLVMNSSLSLASLTSYLRCCPLHFSFSTWTRNRLTFLRWRFLRLLHALPFSIFHGDSKKTCSFSSCSSSLSTRKLFDLIFFHFLVILQWRFLFRIPWKHVRFRCNAIFERRQLFSSRKFDNTQFVPTRRIQIVCDVLFD